MYWKIFALLLLCCSCSGPKKGAKEVPKEIEVAMINVALEVKEIDLSKQWDKVWNPGIIPYEGGYLMAFRAQKTTLFSKKYGVYFIKLNEAFEPLWNTMTFFNKSAEDPRLILCGQTHYIVHNNVDTNGTRQMYVGIIEDNFQVTHVQKLNFPEAEYYREKRLVTPGGEKNWAPFIHDDSLYFVYLIHPHVLIKADPKTGLCSQVSENKTASIWPYGTSLLPPMKRGGTPPVLFDGEYLTFFHSVEKRAIYLFGAYTFEKDYPFAITKETKAPFTAPLLYEGKRKIAFPSGIILNDQGLYLFFGRDDQKIFVAKINQTALRQSLQ